MNAIELLRDLQINLGLTSGGNQELLLYLLNSVMTKAESYCRLDVLPERIRPLIIEIAADRYRRQGAGQSEEKTVVTSISDNGQSVGYKSASAEAVLSTGFTQSEMQALSIYRKAW